MTIDAAPLDGELLVTETEAKQITSRIRQWVKECPIDDIKRAYFGRVWLAMGYDSWAEWCDCELDGFKLPVVERREIVAELTDSGMSQRSIAEVLDVGQSTIRDDIKVSGNHSPDRTVTGQDGKTYTKPKTVADSPRESAVVPIRRMRRKPAADLIRNLAANLTGFAFGIKDYGGVEYFKTVEIGPAEAVELKNRMHRAIGEINKIISILDGQC